MVRNRGILTYACVLALVIGGAGATLQSTDESAAPVVQSPSAVSVAGGKAPAPGGDAVVASNSTD